MSSIRHELLPPEQASVQSEYIWLLLQQSGHCIMCGTFCSTGQRRSMQPTFVLRPLMTLVSSDLCNNFYHHGSQPAGEGFLLSFSLISLCSLSKVYGIFNNSILLSVSARPPRAMTIIYIALVASGYFLDNYFQVSTPTQHWEFCLITHDSVVQIYPFCLCRVDK